MPMAREGNRCRNEIEGEMMGQEKKETVEEMRGGF